ncbi:MAG: hypothetical protein ACREAN_06130, partial [Nitrosopumilaceae archaeon]
AHNYVMDTVTAFRMPEELSYLNSYPNNMRSAAMIRLAEIARCFAEAMIKNSKQSLEGTKCI